MKNMRLCLFMCFPHLANSQKLLFLPLFFNFASKSWENMLKIDFDQRSTQNAGQNIQQGKQGSLKKGVSWVCYCRGCWKEETWSCNWNRSISEIANIGKFRPTRVFWNKNKNLFCSQHPGNCLQWLVLAFHFSFFVQWVILATDTTFYPIPPTF